MTDSHSIYANHDIKMQQQNNATLTHMLD